MLLRAGSLQNGHVRWTSSSTPGVGRGRDAVTSTNVSGAASAAARGGPLRRFFSSVSPSPNRFATRDDVRAFSREVRQLTGGESMHLVCDMMRGPVGDAGIAVSSRQGVNVSAGWQLAQQLTYNSTLLSVKQVTLDHVHFETLEGVAAATELYGRVFKPTVHKEVYRFEDLPRCMHEMHRNTQTGIPIVRVANELPEAFRENS